MTRSLGSQCSYCKGSNLIAGASGLTFFFCTFSEGERGLGSCCRTGSSGVLPTGESAVVLFAPVSVDVVSVDGCFDGIESARNVSAPRLAFPAAACGAVFAVTLPDAMVVLEIADDRDSVGGEYCVPTSTMRLDEPGVCNAEEGSLVAGALVTDFGVADGAVALDCFAVVAIGDSLRE